MTRRWRECVREVLHSWYDMTHANAPYLTPHGVADTLLESLIAEVEAETAADLREELRRALRAVDNLREQHRQRTGRERLRADRSWRHDTNYRTRHDVAVAKGRIVLARALRAERDLNAARARITELEAQQ